MRRFRAIFEVPDNYIIYRAVAEAYCVGCDSPMQLMCYVEELDKNSTELDTKNVEFMNKPEVEDELQ